MDRLQRSVCFLQQWPGLCSFVSGGGKRSNGSGRGSDVVDGGGRARLRLCLQLSFRTSQIFCRNTGLHLKQLARNTTVSLGQLLVSAVYAGCWKAEAARVHLLRERPGQCGQIQFFVAHQQVIQGAGSGIAEYLFCGSAERVEKESSRPRHLSLKAVPDVVARPDSPLQLAGLAVLGNCCRHMVVTGGINRTDHGPDMFYSVAQDPLRWPNLEPSPFKSTQVVWAFLGWVKWRRCAVNGDWPDFNEQIQYAISRLAATVICPPFAIFLYWHGCSQASARSPKSMSCSNHHILQSSFAMGASKATVSMFCGALRGGQEVQTQAISLCQDASESAIEACDIKVLSNKFS